MLDWLCKADFFSAPASTKYHGAYPGGLCQHSIDVYKYAKRLAFLMPTLPSEESLAIANECIRVCIKKEVHMVSTILFPSSYYGIDQVDEDIAEKNLGKRIALFRLTWALLPREIFRAREGRF